MPKRRAAGQRRSDPSPGGSAITLPPRRRRFVVPALLIASVVGVIAATVLFANGGRNITLVLRALDPAWISERSTWIGWLAPSAQPAGDPSTPSRTPVDTTQAAIIPAPAPSSPSPPSAVQEPEADVLPAAQRCDRLASGAQEKPSFTADSADREAWQCTVLLSYADGAGATSLFVQMRGRQGAPFSALRVKFNTAESGITASLAEEALRLVSLSMLRDSQKDEVASLRARLLHWDNFDSMLQGYKVSFKRETSDPTRGNLILVRNSLPPNPPPPASLASAFSGQAAGSVRDMPPQQGPGHAPDMPSATHPANMVPAAMATGTSPVRPGLPARTLRIGKSSRHGSGPDTHP